MIKTIFWNPLYYVSIGMFVLSLVLFPISQVWSILVILSLVTLWSRIPGLVHFIFNKLALNDFFAFIVAASVGPVIGGVFGVVGILLARFFGQEWFPYSLRACIAVFVASIAVPIIITFTGGVNVIALYWFEAVLYVTYYGLVILFWKEEIGLEIAILPGVLFFDFVMNGFLIQAFGDVLSNMMTNNISSGWPFIIFSGIILSYIVLSKNGGKIGAWYDSWKAGKGLTKRKERVVSTYDPINGLKKEKIIDEE